MSTLLSKLYSPILTLWIRVSTNHKLQSSNNNNSGDGSSNSSNDRTNPVIQSPAVECYACTQAGVPAFHSTTCDRTNAPQWEANAGSSLIPIHNNHPRNTHHYLTNKWIFGRVVDPRSKQVQRWNRVILLARAVALTVDPLFFYSLSIERNGAPCLYMDVGLVITVTVLHTCADLVHVMHVWLQFKVAYVSRESLVVGCGKLVWDARMIAQHYLRSVKGFWFDIFVILPVPQVIFWLVVPKLIREEEIKLIISILLMMFLFQFLPKVYHSICVMRKMQKVTGYIFGTIWWGFALNLIAYFIASHVAGGCWYVLSIQRVASCLQQQCEKNNNCNLVSLACSQELCYASIPLPSPFDGLQCANNLTAAVGISSKSICLDADGPFPYGIYKWALPVVSSNSLAVKILYPIFWGLMTLSTFGNDLDPTSNWLEVIFSIIITLSGLILFTLLIGNIQVFLHAVMARKRKMQVRCRDMEWWMKRRQLPSRLRQRVRQYERHRWVAMRGEDEMDMTKDLHEGIRRDIKRYLCLDLIKQVPLFHNLDELILDNICDRVKPLVFSKNEKVIREGDPVHRMIFIVKGRLQSRQTLTKGRTATCMLGPGNFFGDELLSWCLRRPFLDRLPASSSTFECVGPTEAFALDAPHLRYITEHFRYRFANERLKRTARYYSTTWRTWGAVNIQLAWRRWRRRKGEAVEIVVEERRLRQYAALFMSLRPHDHLE